MKRHPEAHEDECPLCNGSGEVSISKDGTYEGTDYYGCPACISRERDEEERRLQALNAELLEALKGMLLSFMCTQNPDRYPSDAPCNLAIAAIAKAEAE